MSLIGTEKLSRISMYGRLHFFVITLIAWGFHNVIDVLQKLQKESDVQQCHLCLLNFLMMIVT